MAAVSLGCIGNGFSEASSAVLVGSDWPTVDVAKMRLVGLEGGASEDLIETVLVDEARADSSLDADNGGVVVGEAELVSLPV